MVSAQCSLFFHFLYFCHFGGKVELLSFFSFLKYNFWFLPFCLFYLFQYGGANALLPLSIFFFLCYFFFYHLLNFFSKRFVKEQRTILHYIPLP